MSDTINIEDLKQDSKNFNKGTYEGETLVRKSIERLKAGRSILIDKDNNIIAGNKTAAAAGSLGLKVKVIETDGTELIAVKRTDLDINSKEGREMALADNRTAQVNLAWDPEQLASVSDQFEGFDPSQFGFDIDTSQVAAPSMNDTLREQMKKRKQWGKDKDYTEPVCNLADMVEIHALRGYRYLHSFKTGTEGAPLSEIKKPESVGLFADKAADLIRSTIGLKQTDGWCIITTPKRRHKEQNFASMVCAELSRRLGIPFHDDVVEAKNRARIDPVFTIVKPVSERNIIIYDDILTGGTTLYTTANLFPDRNLLLIVGINNHR
jgi:phosphoribosylpyrophosphate synthetase